METVNLDSKTEKNLKMEENLFLIANNCFFPVSLGPDQRTNCNCNEEHFFPHFFYDCLNAPL